MSNNSEIQKSSELPNISWEDVFGGIETSKVLWSLKNEYLKFNDNLIYLHTVNRQSILFFITLAKKSKDGILVYPSVRLTVTPLLALEAFYFSYGKKLRNRLCVISSRVELRNEIKKYFMAFRAGSLPLYIDTFPVGRVTCSGDVVRVYKGKSDPKLLISPGIQALPNDKISANCFGVIVELTPELNEEIMKEIIDWKKKSEIPFIFWVSPEPPTHNTIKLIDDGLPYWGWDFQSLYSDCSKDEDNLKKGVFNLEQPFCINYQEIRNKAKGVKKIIIPVKERELNKILSDLRIDYLALVEASSDSKYGNHLAKRFLGCIYALEEMTSPISYAELILDRKWGYLTIKRRMEALEKLVEDIYIDNPILASFAKVRIEKLKEAIHYLNENKTGKHPVILQIIKEALLNQKTVMFIAKNEALNEALQFYLENEKKMNINELKTKGIEFFSANHLYDSLNSHTYFDTCILYGCPRFYQRDVLSFAKTDKIAVIAYESEIPAIKVIQGNIDKKYELFSNSQKKDVVKKLIGTSLLKKLPDSIQPFSKERINTEIIVINPQDAEMGKFEPESIFNDFLSKDWSIDFEYSNDASVISATNGFGGGRNSSVPAMKISLNGGRHILLYAEKQVQIYHDSTDKVRDKTAKNLRVGDYLILIENSTRKSLASSVISKVESHPAMAEAVINQKAWVHYLREGIEENKDSFEDVIEKLAQHGAKEPKTPAAIYLWVNGSIIGPSDLENIKRIGVFYNKQYLVLHWKEIADSIRQLRRLHRSLAVKLNRLIPHAGIEAELHNPENTIIDEKLGLYLEDFANIVAIEQILSVEKIETVPIDELDNVVFD